MITYMHSISRFYTDLVFVKAPCLLFCAMARLIMRKHAVSERMYLHGKPPVKNSLSTTSLRIHESLQRQLLSKKSPVCSMRTLVWWRYCNNPHQYMMMPHPKTHSGHSITAEFQSALKEFLCHTPTLCNPHTINKAYCVHLYTDSFPIPSNQHQWNTHTWPIEKLISQQTLFLLWIPWTVYQQST
jgi:hypothetical protein